MSLNGPVIGKQMSFRHRECSWKVPTSVQIPGFCEGKVCPDLILHMPANFLCTLNATQNMSMCMFETLLKLCSSSASVNVKTKDQV